MTVLEGGVEPRYPTVPGRMKAKKVAIESRTPAAEPAGPGRVRLTLAAAAAEPRRRSSARAPRPRPPSSTCSRGWGCCRDDPGAGGDRRVRRVEVSREAITFARRLAAARWRRPVDAVVVGAVPDGTRSQQLRGVRRPRGAPRRRRRLRRRTPAPRGRPPSQAVRQATGSVVVLAAGTPRGNEVLAHVAARLGVAMAANVVSFEGLDAVRGHPAGGRRRGARGDAARRPAGASSPWPATPCEPVPADVPGAATVVEVTPEVADADLVARVVSTEEPEPDQSAALKSARVVVGAGRGAGSADGFKDLLELTELLGGSLGVSRVVTSLGWRPHHEQVGQTGSRISPGPLRPVRHQRRDPALGRLLEREDHPGDQHRRRRADGHQGALRRHRRPARGRPGDQRGDQPPARLTVCRRARSGRARLAHVRHARDLLGRRGASSSSCSSSSGLRANGFFFGCRSSGSCSWRCARSGVESDPVDSVALSPELLMVHPCPNPDRACARRPATNYP